MIDYNQFKIFKKAVKKNRKELWEKAIENFTDIKNVELGDRDSFANDKNLKKR